jgi:hypothetical protein
MSAKTTEIEPTYVVHLPTRREKKSFVPSWPPFKGSQQGAHTFSQPLRDVPKNKTKYLDIEEYRRRDKIIKDHYNRCIVKVGDRVRPMDDKTFKDNGWYKVMGIDKNWDDYCGNEVDETQVKWPSNDVPMIVHALGEKPETGACVATFMFFRKPYPAEQQ